MDNLMKGSILIFSANLVMGGLFAVEPDSAPAKTFPAYPIPDEIIETPVMNSAMMYAGLHGAGYQQGFQPGMLLGLSFFLRDFFAARAEMVIPLKKSSLDASYSGRVSDLSRNEPVLLRAGGNMRLLRFSRVFLYIPALAGIELNRNNDEAYAAQMFVDLGAGGQIFFASLFFAQLEYTYHFSQIPLSSGYYINHNYHGGSLSFGMFF